MGSLPPGPILEVEFVVGPLPGFDGCLCHDGCIEDVSIWLRRDGILRTGRSGIESRETRVELEICLRHVTLAPSSRGRTSNSATHLSTRRRSADVVLTGADRRLQF